MNETTEQPEKLYFEKKEDIRKVLETLSDFFSKEPSREVEDNQILKRIDKGDFVYGGIARVAGNISKFYVHIDTLVETDKDDASINFQEISDIFFEPVTNGYEEIRFRYIEGRVAIPFSQFLDDKVGACVQSSIAAQLIAQAKGRESYFIFGINDRFPDELKLIYTEESSESHAWNILFCKDRVMLCDHSIPLGEILKAIEITEDKHQINVNYVLENNIADFSPSPEEEKRVRAEKGLNDLSTPIVAYVKFGYRQTFSEDALLIEELSKIHCEK